MNFNIRLDRNFTIQFNSLKEEFGEDFAKLNGFADNQLSYTDFIDNFIASTTVADASVDGNANVGSKDMRTLMNEMPKPHRKLIAFNKIYYELNKKYGHKVANDWIRAEWTKALYMHDADTSTYVHYCYKGDESFIAYYNGNKLLTTFKQLFNLIEEKEVIIDPAQGVVAKFPKELYVEDFVNGEFVNTKVSQVTKRVKNESYRFIKTSNGFTQIVTENHPMITSNGEKSANKTTVEDKLTTFSKVDWTGDVNDIYAAEILYNSKDFPEGTKIVLNGKIVTADSDKRQSGQVYIMLPQNSQRGRQLYTYTVPISNKIHLSENLGYILGLMITDGSYNYRRYECNIGQKDGEISDKLVDCLVSENIPFVVYGNNAVKRYNIKSKTLSAVIALAFLDRAKGQDKLFNPNIINYNIDFIRGVIAGFVDGDGTVDSKKSVISGFGNSRAASNQLIYMLRACGYSPRTNNPTDGDKWFRFGCKRYSDVPQLSIPAVKLIGVPVDSLAKFSDSCKFANKRYTYQDNLAYVYTNLVIDSDDKEVFDITTESGHFICNQILSHNCFAYDLKDLAEKGLFFLNTFNAEPPQHMSTFVDFVKEYISFASNRSSGAVGLPNLIPYLYYFWKKDCDTGYATKSPEYYARQQIQRFIYAVNQPYVRDGMQSAFTNVSVFDEPYLEALFGGAEFPDGSFMIDSLSEIKEFQKTFMEVVAEIRSRNMFTFPVLTISLLRQNNKFVDQDFAIWGIKHNMKWSDSNLFIDNSVTSLSNCCRLKSNIDDLGYFNSIGGTALKVGSVKVSTVNLARIALEANSEDDFLHKLEEKVELDCQVLDVIRNIIERNVEKGLLPNFSKGLVDFEHLYNTVGVIGIYETMKTFGYVRQDEFGNTYYTSKADAFGKRIFDVIHATKDFFAKDKDYKINLEQIPGETAAVKMQQADVLLYPDRAVTDLPLYGNQFIPLGIKTTIQERVRIASLFDSYCNGGSIAHINIEAPFATFEEAWKMTEYIADHGLTYFAYNMKIQACKHNHAFFGKICPVCGEPVETEYTRIVGFYTPIKTWSHERKEEFKLREWHEL